MVYKLVNKIYIKEKYRKYYVRIFFYKDDSKKQALQANFND